MGIMLYMFFAEATGGAVPSVLDRENLVRKIHFPRMVIPLSVVLTALLNLAAQPHRGRRLLRALGRRAALELAARSPAARRCSSRSRTGLAMLLSALFVRYRDVQPIWDVVLHGRCSTRRRSSTRSSRSRARAGAAR